VTEIVAVDLGGTHARFAVARIEDRRVAQLGEAVTLEAANHAGFESAWRAFAQAAGRPLPTAAAIAVAGPVAGERLRLTNNGWEIEPARLPAALGLERVEIVNDFGAVAHAVAELEPRWFAHLCGPDVPLPEEGVTSVIGPGTGLGVALLLRSGGRRHVVETEGSHIGFAPLDPVEDALLARLRARFGRVSVERLASGPGLADLHEAMGGGRYEDDRALWEAALSGADPNAAAALDRFCLILGSAAGDIALAQGAKAVVIGGGLGLRLASRLPASGFASRFVEKGRFRGLMESLPVKLLTHPQPGLYGAAAAFAARL
jgi:glucokinase